MSRLAVMGAAARYEFVMQARRWAVWAIVGGLAALPLLVNSDLSDRHFGLRELIGDQVLFVMVIAPIAVGGFLADRLIRDRRLGVEEILDTLPAGYGSRLWGKYLGVTAAVCLPLALVWALGVGRIVAQRHDLAAVPLGIAAFLAVVLPGVLLVAAGALAFPTRLGMPLFRVLFVGFWFWGNLASSGIPSLTSTWLTPIGWYASSGLFHGFRLGQTDRHAPMTPTGPGHFASVGDAISSIILLVACACVVMAVVQPLETRRRMQA